MPITKIWKELREIYSLIEEARMRLYVSAARQEEEFEIDASVGEDILLEEGENYIKFSVKEVLPHQCRVKRGTLRDYWGAIIKRVSAHAEKRFQKALCVIAIYAPRECEWDVDNRAYSAIFNGLRSSRIIKNDSWDRLALLVVGGADEGEPRTEIYVIETEEFSQVFKSLLSAKKPVTKMIPAQVDNAIQEENGEAFWA